MGQFCLLWNFCAKANLVIQHPTRGRNLYDTGIVKGFQVWIEIRISPDFGQLRGANGVGPVRGFQIDRVAYRCFATSVRSNLTTVRKFVFSVWSG